MHMTQTPSLSHMVSRAWPEGLPEEDAALIRKLSAEDECLIAVRLSALLEVEAGMRPASRAPDGDGRPLTDNGFQSLVRRWRADRRVSTLLPYASRSSRRRGDTPDHRAVVGSIDELLRADPEMGLVALSRQAAARSCTDLAPNSVKLIARERRAALRSDPDWIASRYADGILCDVCALAADVANAAGEESAAVMALVVEGASGIILGHAVGDAAVALDLQRSAMANALVRTITERLDIVGSEPASLKMVIAPGQDVPTLRYAAAVRAASPAAGIVDSPRRRAGDRAADLLDGSIDVLRLRPRGGRPTRRATASTWEEARLIQVADEAVTAHNGRRIALLRSALPEASGTSMGRIVATLRSVVDAG